MWNDSFITQINNFIRIFYGKEWFWGDIINGTTVSILLFAVFTLVAAVVLIVNGTACGEIKLSRTLKGLRVFMARFGVIQKGNFVHFNKICMSKMPRAAKKCCARFVFNPTTQNQADLKRSLTKCVKRSCTNAFIAYMLTFGLGAIFAIATISLETIYLDGNNLFLAVSLFYGTMLLVAMALQMYFIGNKYANVDLQVYTEIVSRYLREEDAQKVTQKISAKAKTSEMDSIDELRRVVFGLIESGASKELLAMFRDGLMNIAATNYNGASDQLRLENIVSSINSYIA